MKPWKIFYDDGTTFSSDDGQPHEAPAFGFICAVGYDERGERYTMKGWDHYCFDEETDQWWGMDLSGLFDRLARNKVYAYKMGRTVSKTRYQEILHQSHEDEGFRNSKWA